MSTRPLRHITAAGITPPQFDKLECFSGRNLPPRIYRTSITLAKYFRKYSATMGGVRRVTGIIDFYAVSIAPF